jgi:PAS domain S-box-containing protein
MSMKNVMKDRSVAGPGIGVPRNPIPGGRKAEHPAAVAGPCPVNEALAASELRYRRLFETAKDGILILDAESGMVVDVNPFLVELLGFSREAFIGKKLWELGFFKDIVANQDHFAELQQQRYIRYEDKPLETAEGRRIDVEFVSNVYLVNRQNVIQCNIRDITARKRTEAALKESERFAQATLDALSEHIAVLDDAGTIIAVNRAWRAFAESNLPLVSDINPGTNYLAVCDGARGPYAEDAAAVAAGIRAVISGARSAFELEYPCHSPETKRWFVCRVSRFPGPGTVRVVVAHENITERKQSGEVNARLAMAVEQVAETIVVTDADANILYANPAFETTTGYTREEAIGRNPRFLKSGKQDADFYRRMWAVLGSGEVWRGHFINQRKDGTRYEEDASISPVRDTAGKVVNYVAAKRDVTHEVQLEDQLRQAQKMDAVGRLAGGVAHDFNNLLMSIMGYAELCREEIAPDHPIREWLNEITREAQRSAEITRQLLAFARKQVIAPRVLDLNDAVAGMLKMLRRLIGEDINLAWLPGANLRPVKLDPSQVDQILANLCINARDAIAGVGKITLETGNTVIDATTRASHADAIPGAYVFLAVGDTGAGMSPEILAQIFEPFFTTKGIGKGTGLGLATVYGIAKQNHGFIYAYSEPGRGATFKIYLPQVADAAVEAAVSCTTKTPAGQGETILLVEDEKSLRRICHRFLESLGYNLLVAETPEEALTWVGQHPGDIQLLLTDVVMPGLDGRQLANRIGAARPGIKVLFMSGYTADVMADRGVLEENTAFIGKPFTRDALARKVREVLDTHEAAT